MTRHNYKSGEWIEVFKLRDRITRLHARLHPTWSRLPLEVCRIIYQHSVQLPQTFGPDSLEIYTQDRYHESFPPVLNINHAIRAEAFHAAVQTNTIELLYLHKALPHINRYIKANNLKFSFLRNIHTTSLTIKHPDGLHSGWPSHYQYRYRLYSSQTTDQLDLATAIALLKHCPNIKRLTLANHYDYSSVEDVLSNEVGLWDRIRELKHLHTITIEGFGGYVQPDFSWLQRQMCDRDLGIEIEVRYREVRHWEDPPKYVYGEAARYIAYEVSPYIGRIGPHHFLLT